MRLQELFETTEEDRALISLSSAIYDALQQYADEDLDTEPEYDPDFDHIPTDTPAIVVGKIGDLFDTPVRGLDNLTIELLSPEGMREKMDKGNVDVTKGPKGDIKGIWSGDNSTVYFNKDYLGSNSLKSTITHELRHALDDVKSGGQANKVGGRYSIPRNKAYRGKTNDPELGNVHYLAEPAEINARFTQVLHSMVPVIARAVKLAPDQIEPAIMRAFKKSLEAHHISNLFPEKEKSRDYKRLIKRGMDFIQKETSHAKQLQK